MARKLILATFLALAATLRVTPQGKVYLVLGSDTAIWDNMDVARYSPHYNLSLYIAPSDNVYAVMNPAFRNNLVDSYGQTLKMTWWMMAGDIFRYADNTDVPIPNIMTLYLMKKYHGTAIQQWGDELTLHYHTFAWTDYDGDGKYYWNQAHAFDECRDDFDFTLAQFLLEENVFPVSFRSGWHAMDNGWQAYLNTLLPYSLHDDYPNIRQDPTEPIDNVYDWSKASGEFVPFQPSDSNYQLPGGEKGWNVRSIHMGNVGLTLMDKIFAAAAAGKDQVACLWAHLPETDFLTNIRKIDSLAHVSAGKYANVQFRYCTAVEAMQRWRGLYGLQGPQVTLQENDNAGNATFTVTVDKPIFQNHPIVAVKDIYRRYQLLPMTRLSSNTWQSSVSVPVADFAKAGVAVTDTAGNLATDFIQRLPDDSYVDNSDPQYSELSGAWSSITTSCWGVDSRFALLGANDTAIVRWVLPVTQDGRYNIFVRTPVVSSVAGKVVYEVYSGSTRMDSVYFADPIPSKEWVFVSSAVFDHTVANYLVMSVPGFNQAGKYASADVIRLTPLVPARALVLSASLLDFGTVSQYDTATLSLQVANNGSGPLTIQNITANSGRIATSTAFPLTLPAMKRTTLSLRFGAEHIGTWVDTLTVESDDPIRPKYALPCTGSVETYFVLADNDDSLSYQESGPWHLSNAQAWGATSRYANLSDLGSYAQFQRTLRVAGKYNIFGILPTTVNASNRALYLISADGFLKDSLFLDQNAGSGKWVLVGSYNFSAGSTVTVKIMNTGLSTAGAVLRADAIKIASVSESTSALASGNRDVPGNFSLDQNFPNPFNPSTGIRFSIARAGMVSIRVYDVLGRTISILVDQEMYPGIYKTVFDASKMSSGIYIYELRCGDTRLVKRMTLIK